MAASIGGYLVVMIGCTLLLYVIHELFRRFVRSTTAFWVLVLLSCPIWISNLGDWFLVIKTLMMIVAIIIISITRLRYALANQNEPVARTNILLWLIYLALILNIAVALIPDIEVGNCYNALTGLMLCILVPLPPKGWRVDTARYKCHDLLVDLSFVWCLLYASWWLNLVYDIWPRIFSRGICLMVVTFIPLIIYRRSELWFSIRAYTLAFYMLTIALFDYSIPSIDSVIGRDDTVKILWGGINLVLIAVYTIWWFSTRRRRLEGRLVPALTPATSPLIQGDRE